MSDFFSVTPSSLESEASGLTTVAGELTALAKMKRPSGGQLGGPAVATAVEDFFTSWSYEVQELEKVLSSLATNVKAAIVAYEKTDACVAQGSQP